MDGRMDGRTLHFGRDAGQHLFRGARLRTRQPSTSSSVNCSERQPQRHEGIHRHLLAVAVQPAPQLLRARAPRCGDGSVKVLLRLCIKYVGGSHRQGQPQSGGSAIRSRVRGALTNGQLPLPLITDH
jgi:hypothetical protein